MRTGALRLIWSNPNKSNCKQILDQLGHKEIKKKSKVAKIAHTGTRTRNLLLRRQAPYPLGHTGISDFSLCHQKKSPRSRSRTSDLEISIASSYSLPLYQLSYTRNTSTEGGVAQMVERTLSMREAQGSIPCSSIFFAARSKLIFFERCKSRLIR
jgi:hypothetical protein